MRAAPFPAAAQYGEAECSSFATSAPADLIAHRDAGCNRDVRVISRWKHRRRNTFFYARIHGALALRVDRGEGHDRAVRNSISGAVAHWSGLHQNAVLLRSRTHAQAAATRIGGGLAYHPFDADVAHRSYEVRSAFFLRRIGSHVRYAIARLHRA